jgi:hypothetical protein
MRQLRLLRHGDIDDLGDIARITTFASAFFAPF